jgi:hypothetical protein
MNLFMKNRKGDLSINIIVVAAIALLVLVVLAVLFIGKIGMFAKESDRCKGRCVDSEECLGQYQTTNSGVCLDSEGKNDPAKVCCITIVSP